MKVTLERGVGPFEFLIDTESGHQLQVDANEEIGGTDTGARPMELILAGLAGCSAIDVVHLLRKKRTPPETLKVTVDGTRREGAIPAIFVSINVHFEVKGAFKAAEVEHILKLTFEKYCSVSIMLEKSAEITYTYEILP